MDNNSRFYAAEVGGKSIEADMNPVLPVVDITRRVVRKKYVHRREIAQKDFHFLLIVEKMPPRLVSPRPMVKNRA